MTTPAFIVLILSKRKKQRFLNSTCYAEEYELAMIMCFMYDKEKRYTHIQ